MAGADAGAAGGEASAASAALLGGKYELAGEAGRGTFCSVSWAKDAKGQPFAVKAFSKGAIARRFVAKFSKGGDADQVPLKETIDEEIRLLRKLQHPNVMPLIEVIDTEASLFVVLEGLVGGILMEWQEAAAAYAAEARPEAVRQLWGDKVLAEATEAAPAGTFAVFGEAAAAYLVAHLLAGLAYLHESDVVHKDLKPDNLLLNMPVPAVDPRFVRWIALEGWPSVQTSGGVPAPDLEGVMRGANWTLKIGDFNSAEESKGPESWIYDAQGTSQFTPPECFLDASDGVRGPPRDIWSVGIILYVMLFGRCPYWADVPLVMQLSIMGHDEEFVLPSGVISADAEALIRALMDKDAKLRPTAPEALKHAWLNSKASP